MFKDQIHLLTKAISSVPLHNHLQSVANYYINTVLYSVSVCINILLKTGNMGWRDDSASIVVLQEDVDLVPRTYDDYL